MNIAIPPGTASALERAQALLLSRFADAGYERVEPPILQGAGTFLDLGGEDIRARLFLTSDGAGAELCLRPEYTIPACRAYLASPRAGKVASYSYCGPVFRARPGASGEFVQAGLESFGRTDAAAADAEILAMTLDAVETAGLPDVHVSLGDAGLFARVLDALELPPPWQRRLKRGLEKGTSLDAILEGAPDGSGSRAGVLAALDGADPRDARALVEDLLQIAGIATVGGRSVGEIAERFLSQIANRGTPGFSGERRAALARVLAITGDPDGASATLRALARDAALDLDEALDLFDARTGFIAAHGVAPERLRFHAAFARNLDYYTGFVFEVRAAGDAASSGPLAAGGRYDRLATSLGSSLPVPAVGASLWLERLAGAAE